MFHSIRTIGNGITQHLVANHMHPDILTAINLTIPSTTGRRHDVAKKMISWLLQCLIQRKLSLALTFSNVLIVKKTIKWIATLIGKTVSIKNGTIENNRNSMSIEYSNIAILLSIGVIISLFFSIYMLFAYEYI